MRDTNYMNNLAKYLNDRTAEYDAGHPTISDEEWDTRYFELKMLEADTGYIPANSPTQKIHYEVVSQLKKVEHNHKMLSLDKTKDWDEFLKYFSGRDVIGMLKLDGLTCSLQYIDGKLVSAETRGNGIIGEDVLHNARVIPSIPKEIEYKDELIVDGEIICKNKDFTEFADEYANPRNFASGSIRLLDSRECSKRKLTFVVWNIVKGYNDTNSVLEKLNRAQYEGFEVVPWTSSFDWDAKEFLIDHAAMEGYPYDGLVGRFDDIAYGEGLGETGHHSRAAYAFKFYDEEYETHLRDIEWTMGRTGILTPVAIFDPVDTGDSIIERASLHNISIMNEIMGDNAYVGERIRVAKMNMIIPQVVHADYDSPKDVKLITIPNICPICGGATKIEESDSGTKNLICTNPSCEGKLINRLDHFCGKKGMDIKGLSIATLEKLIDLGWVNTITDIYSLTNYRNDWIKLAGFGPKSVDNILTAIEKSRHCELSAFITAIGIPLIGSTASKQIAKEEPTWTEFRDDIMNKADFSKLENFGPEMNAAIHNFDYTEMDNLVNIFDISNNIYYNNNVSNNSSLKNMNIVITGKLTIYKNRSALEADIEKCGGKVVGSVSKNTNYLINNDAESTSSKNISAKKLGIPILTEKDFIEKYLIFIK